MCALCVFQCDIIFCSLAWVGCGFRSAAAKESEGGESRVTNRGEISDAEDAIG